MLILYYEPYVLFNLNSRRVSFFNLLNGHKLEFINTSTISKILEKKSYNCFIIENIFQNNKYLRAIALELEQQFMGGIIETSDSKAIVPFVHPCIKMSESFKEYIKTKKILDRGDSVKRLLYKLTVHLDSYTQKSNDGYNKMARQLSFMLHENTNCGCKLISLKLIKNYFFELQHN